MISIDGIRYDVKAEVQRTAEIRASDICGQMLDGSYFNDVQGTYMEYTIALKYPLHSQDKYAGLYEALTAPVDGHVFVLPYNHDELTVTARVERVPDQWVERDSGRKYWKAMQFSVIANHPTKTLSLDEVIARGRTPFPDVATAAVDDTYRYTENGWARVEYADADEVYY